MSRGMNPSDECSAIEHHNGQERSKQEMLDFIAERADIDQATTRRAFAGDEKGLTDIFNIISRNAKAVQDTALVTAATLPLSLALLFNQDTKSGVVFGVVATLFALGFRQATRAIDVSRETILARLGTPKPQSHS